MRGPTADMKYYTLQSSDNTNSKTDDLLKVL